MSAPGRRRAAFARLLGSAVVSQALLSAASFVVGLLLIRRSSDLQYGAYILAANAIALLASLQNAFFAPTLAERLPRLDGTGRAELVGGLHHAQRRLLAGLGAALIVVVAGLWAAGVLDRQRSTLVLVTLAAALAVLHREYVRLVLLAHKRPQDVLRSDLCHVALLVAGVYAATFTAAPAAVALAALCLAGAASAGLLVRALWRHEAWSRTGTPGLVREIAPLAAWSIAGAAIHWSFSQGNLYLVAGMLDVAAVASIAATRLLLMPVNLLSTGIGSLMLPLASGWLHRHGAVLLRRRLAAFALGMVLATLAYFALLWGWREEVFAVVLRKQFARRDELLLLWGAIFLVMAVRDQLIYLPAAQGRYRALTLLTLGCAVVSLAAGWVGMRQFGVTGALLGLLLGELMSLSGVVRLMLRRTPPRVSVPA